MKKISRIIFLITVFVGVSSPLAHAAPDLRIEGIGGVKATYTAGDPMPNFKVFVKNIGSSAFPSASTNTNNIFRVLLYECTYTFNGHDYSCKMSFQASAPRSTPHLSGISPGETVTIRWPLLWPGVPTNSFQEGEYNLRFRVKSPKYESDYNNNYYSVNISVSKPEKTLKVIPKNNIELVPKKKIQIPK